MTAGMTRVGTKRTGFAREALTRGVCWLAGGCTVALLGGCSGFFSKTTVPAGGSTSGDYVYVVNSATGTLSGFGIGGATLSTLSGSPFTVTTGFAPASVAVTRQNTLLYVGGVGGIVCYSIGGAGALTLVPAGGVLAQANFVSLETSPDGNWLLGLDSVTQTIYVYQIQAATGALVSASVRNYAVPGGGLARPSSLRISPNGQIVGAALGTGGDVFFTFNTATGALSAATAGVSVASGSDNDVFFDLASAFVFVAHTGTVAGASGVASYSVSSAGVLAAVGTLAVSGAAPQTLALDSTGGFLYTANRGDSTISGFTVLSGQLTPLPSSPYASGKAVTALAIDNSGKYLVASAPLGASDVTLYGFDAITPGKLGAVAVAASGVDPAGSLAVAATHK